MKAGRVFLYPFLVCLLCADGLFLCLRGGGYANSIQNPGHSLDLNPIKIRKLLITKGVYFPSTAAKLFCCSSKGKRTFTLVT
jgi:hypothetical protein